MYRPRVAEIDDVNDPEHWEKVYRSGEIRWDKGRASPPLVRLAGEGVIPKGASVAVPGAGKGHDAVMLAQHGYAVTAIDFAPSAADAMRANAKAAGVDMKVVQGDVFELAALGPFDAVVEHTIFCAIDPQKKQHFADAGTASLAPGGLYLGVFYAHGKEGGPPYTPDEAEVRRLYESHYEIVRLRRAPDGFPERLGNELEFVFRKK